MKAKLTAGTEQRIALLFATTERDLVATLLVDDCGNDLPLLDSACAVDLERIRFAVLKVSRGDLNELQLAIDLAKEDWRDVLVVAGFENDVKAHESWWPTAAGLASPIPHGS